MSSIKVQSSVVPSLPKLSILAVLSTAVANPSARWAAGRKVPGMEFRPQRDTVSLLVRSGSNGKVLVATGAPFDDVKYGVSSLTLQT